MLVLLDLLDDRLRYNFVPGKRLFVGGYFDAPSSTLFLVIIFSVTVALRNSRLGSLISGSTIETSHSSSETDTCKSCKVATVRPFLAPRVSTRP